VNLGGEEIEESGGPFDLVRRLRGLIFESGRWEWGTEGAFWKAIRSR
jgi:hypothetical protein